MILKHPHDLLIRIFVLFFLRCAMKASPIVAEWVVRFIWISMMTDWLLHLQVACIVGKRCKTYP